MSKPIYMVVAFYIENTESARTDGICHSRNWGWYHSFEKAERAVLENYIDLFESGYYNYCCIGESPEGILSLVTNIRWYKSNYDEISKVHSIVTVAEPKALELTILFP